MDIYKIKEVFEDVFECEYSFYMAIFKHKYTILNYKLDQNTIPLYSFKTTINGTQCIIEYPKSVYSNFNS
jgi:hypothetical protein